MGKNIKAEERLLKKSIIYMLIFSIFGIVFGVILSSSLIIFDALYSLLGVGLSYLTYKISRYINKKDDFNFPFGKELLEPGIILLQYIIILFVLIYTFINAIVIIKNGGIIISIGWTILYLVFSTLFLVFVFFNLKKQNNKIYSSLVDAEVTQWKLSFLQSGGSLIGYSIAQIIMLLSSSNKILPYVDPVILLIVITVLLKTPITEIIKATKELLGMRNISDSLEEDMKDKLNQICDMYDIQESHLRVQKIGSSIFIEINFLVDKEFKYSKVEEQDIIREKVNQSLSFINYDIWLTIAFTSHIKWIL